MKAIIKLALILTIVSTLIISCGAATPVSAPTEVPVTQPPATDPPVATETPLTETPTEEPADDHLVVVLVVDSFSTVETEETPDSSENCTVTPDGQKATGRESATMTLNQPHGIFVYTDLISNPQLLVEEAAGPVNHVSSGDHFVGTDLIFANQHQYPWIKRYDLYEFSEEERLLVVAIDTDGLNLDSIENNLRTILDEMSSYDILLGEIPLPPTRRFVVNMSFVLVPCDPASVLGIDVEAERSAYYENSKDYEEVNAIPPLSNLRTRLENIYSYSEDSLSNLQEQLQAQIGAAFTLNIEQLLALEEDQKSQLIDEAVFEAYITYLIYVNQSRDWQSDSFYNTLSEYFYDKQLEIVYVGAAGNFVASFPFAPASWDFVDSISSEAADQDNNPNVLPGGVSLAGYSNWGEVRMSGVHPSNDQIIGTSFAAPKFSYQIARYLLLEGGMNTCSGSSPALGYATHKDPVFMDEAEVLIEDNNLSYEEAMSQYCQ